ncbi:Myb-like DNA-binding domain-containing protein [Gautieria morchelliformis]|nr:Myb-like DNA-binding domain-containing protein [Gautieria morchelliformis]
MAAQHLPKSHRSTNPNLPAIGPSIANPAHTEMLATKWLSSSKLKELVSSEGLVYKKGKFSSIEQHTLRTAIENYRVTSGLSQEQIVDVIFSKAKEEHANFWSEITATVPARPITAVYHYVHRAYNPLGLQGKWTKEEDAALISAVGDHGQAWQTIKERVGRSPQDCRDRWRNHLANRSERQRGYWSKAEEEELTNIVQELTTAQGKNSDSDIFWGIVSKRMGNKRGRQQCRVKWTDSLNKTVKNGGEKPKWSKQDAFILVHKIASMDILDDSEVDWKLLNDEDWNLWSAHTLQRQWRRLKQAIKGYEEMRLQGSFFTFILTADGSARPCRDR